MFKRGSGAGTVLRAAGASIETASNKPISRAIRLPVGQTNRKFDSLSCNMGLVSWDLLNIKLTFIKH